MMCADWSPDSSCSDLIAVGLTTGKTLLVRMHEHMPLESPYPSSESTPTVAYRPALGRSQLRHSTSNGQQYPTLAVKMSRPCNVVSFSKTHPHLLAAGLDKVRNDPCLLVWDVSQAIDNYSGSPSGVQTPTTNFPTRPDLRTSNAAGWKTTDGRYVESNLTDSLYLGNPETYREQKPIQQYGSSEAIASCAWSIHAGSPLLIAGMGNKYLRVYDIRVDANVNPLQFSTKAVYGAMVDPFHPYRLASYTEEGVIKVWDIQGGVKNNLSRLQFSPLRSGLLASLSKDSTYIHTWDIQETSTLRVGVNYSRSTPTMTTTSTTLRPSSRASASGSSLQTLTSGADEISLPVLWKSRKTAPSSKVLSSFAFIPRCRGNRSAGAPSHGILAMHKDGQFENIKLQEACKISWQAAGEIMLAGGNNLCTLAISGEEGLKKKLPKLRFDALGIASHASAASDEKGTTARDTVESDGVRITVDQELSKELAKDISVIMRSRCSKNVEITKDDRRLQELWSWMERAEQMSKDSVLIKNIDYSFQGVYGIWMGPGSQGRKSSPASTPRTSNAPSPHSRHSQSSRSSKALIKEASPQSPAADEDDTNKANNSLSMVQSSKTAQRNLALAVCGFGFTATQLEEELVRLEARGEYDKAAGWALFCGIPERAIRALGSARGSRGTDDQQRKLMSAVLAGYQPNSTNVNPMWQELCLSLSKDMLDRPYLRAIFAYIASNDWYKILNEADLPLRERMAVALRVLNDEEMTTFLNATVEQLIREGNIEGVVVTGLTSRGVDLLEQALNRYGDVQTASLVMSFVVPRRFQDKRVETWVEKLVSYKIINHKN
ncbi:hypothetical protein EC973_001115 [Apophysomyces ossiformis]|uniref:MIOS-like alpha-solenoid domain-containing protein n=1 Tax=Apophysomyces ossiformis TaxID=679940 RepID=A0A8H7BIE0_9FUNG|nr:hypothetical protein EC973_001115 [Apophysomyces ossiformis]